MTNYLYKIILRIRLFPPSVDLPLTSYSARHEERLRRGAGTPQVPKNWGAVGYLNRC